MEPFHSPTGNPYPYYGFPTTVMNICRTPTSPIPSPCKAMDPRIWGSLPHKLIDRVLVFLPPPAFFRSRSVCKRWYGLLFSSKFLEMYLQVSPDCHWFIFFKHKGLKPYICRGGGGNDSEGSGSGSRSGGTAYEGYLFDPRSLTWYRLSFPSIPMGFSPVTSSGGLIGWVSDDAGPKNVLLSNPLVGSSSVVPIAPTLRPRLFPSIGSHITRSSIDLVVAGDDLTSQYAVKNLTAESFHVDAGGSYSIWGTAAALPRLCSFEPAGNTVYAGGRFYCMNSSPFGVLSYDVSSNTWRKIQPPMRRFLRSPNLVAAGGGGRRQLMLVAAVEKRKLSVPRSLRMWALRECGATWAETEKMPQELYIQFAEREGGKGFHCAGHGNFVVITAKNSAAVMFDLHAKKWVWVPPCPFVRRDSPPCNGGGGGELRGFAYEPRLATPATALLDHLSLPF